MCVDVSVFVFVRFGVCWVVNRYMYVATQRHGTSLVQSTTCAHKLVFMSFSRRAIVTSCLAFCSPTFIE